MKVQLGLEGITTLSSDLSIPTFVDTERLVYTSHESCNESITLNQSCRCLAPIYAYRPSEHHEVRTVARQQMFSESSAFNVRHTSEAYRASGRESDTGPLSDRDRMTSLGT